MKKLLFLTIFLAIPAQTFASGCDCGTINGMLTMNREQTVQMVNAHTTAEGEPYALKFCLPPKTYSAR